jgi:hypothetical protein
MLPHYTNIIRIKKPREIIRAGYMALMGETINQYKFSVGNQRKRPSGRLCVGGKIIMLTRILKK